jgi:cyclic beta-1,2-glucan synthetase
VRAHLCDRVDFIGANGTLDNPRYIRNHQEARRADTTFNVPTSSAWPRINNKALGANFDPCALLECGVTLSPRGSSNSSVKLLFFLGECEAVDQLSAHVNYARSFKAHRESEKARQERFKEELFSIQVRTPDRAFDVLMNGWLLYQTKGARLDGRTGFYQSGGAFGFRDQLQDVLAFLNNKPQLAREQILLHAAHQFIEGDVQHWWHPPTGRGVRTKISDDYLWLPYVVAKYLTVTGDLSLLDEEVPFLEGRELGESEEAYFQPGISPELGNIKEHCLRALHRGLELRSARGLPLMGSGDWNDGMNRVGRHGTGESIWLGWFLGASLLEFAPWLENSDPSTASYFRKEAQALKEALNLHGFDGEWYRRAYFDDGTPLGSSSNKECKIDSVAQSWSVISGLGEPEKSQQGFNSLLKYLVDEESKIIKLLTPAFGEVSEENEGSNRLDPGYIAGYLPGVRENGGQYTHAAAWSVIAASMLGLKDEAYKLFSIINPLTHALSKEGQERYQGEPYVLCGDVYGVFPHVGKAGWSWYTGSAGWLYQAGLHYILGLRVTHEGLSIADTLPGAWNESAITYNRKGSLITVRIERGNEKGHYIVSNSGRLTKVSTPIPWPTKGEDLTVIRVV